MKACVQHSNVRASLEPSRAFQFFIGALAAVGLVFKSMARAADPSEQVDPHALVAEMREQRPASSSEMLAVLTVRAKGADKRQVSVRITTQLQTEFWKTRYEILGALNKGKPPAKEIMEVTFFGSKPPQYEWRPGEFEAGIAQSNTSFGSGSRDSLRPFGGSDFQLADLGLEFLYWPGQKIVGRQVRRTRDCVMLESVPENVVDGGYARVLSWVDIKTHQLVRAEGFDGSGRRVKMFKPDEFVYYKGQWRVKQLAIESSVTGSESYLIFNFRDKPEGDRLGGKP